MKHRTTIEDLRNKLRGSPVEELNPHLFEEKTADLSERIQDTYYDKLVEIKNPIQRLQSQ